MRTCLGWMAVFLSSCTSPVVPEQTPGAEPPVSVTVLPPAGLDRVLPVSRLFVRGSDLRPDELMLFEGELSEYHARRVRDSDLPSTLLQRRVPALGWSSNGELVLAPSVPLTLAAVYTLAGLGEGPIVAIRVVEQAAAVAPRLWPPPSAAGGAGHVVYCGLGVPPAPLGFISFDPGAWLAELLAGADGLGTLGDSCVTLRPLAPLGPDELVVPPLELFGSPLEPAPVQGGAASPAMLAECAASEVRLGLGCARVLDDRAVVTGPSVPSLWVFRSPPLLPRVRVLGPGEKFVAKGLAPASLVPVELVVRDLADHVADQVSVIQTSAPLSHLILSEVLANPLGPEPAQEWIELYNDGAGPIDLSGFRLSDSGGEIELPSFIVPAGSFVVLAREDFVLDDGSDVPLSPAVPLVRLKELGKNGLSNSGEKLVLRRPDGSIASELPAVPKPKSGVSVARRPDAPDDLPSSFHWHAAPGASPGAPNSLASEED